VLHVELLRIELKTWVKVAVLAGGVPPELLLDPLLEPPELPLDPLLEPAPASAGAGLPTVPGPGEPAFPAAPRPPLEAPELEEVEPELPPEAMPCPPFELPPEFELDELALVPEAGPVVSASSPAGTFDAASSVALAASSPGAVPPPEAALHPASAIDATSARGAMKISPRRTIPGKKTGPCIIDV